ncbi:MAG: hypothetical protein ACSNEK_06510 [Parachlamydiaceae bacterium]
MDLFETINKKYPHQWQKDLILNKVKLASICNQGLEETIFCEGQDLVLPDVKSFPPIVQSIYYLLFTEQTVQINKKTAFKFLLINADPVLLHFLSQLVQYVLDHLFSQLRNKRMTFSNVLFIQHLLAYYPFFGFLDGDYLNIPQYLDNDWKMVTYQATKLHLTPAWMGSSITACALVPLDPKASGLLIFKGTSYPTDEGFALSLLTDMNPFASVGGYAFYLGKDRIRNWLQARSLPTTLIGLSLGGALALHTVATYASYINKVYAFNPPALFKGDLIKWEPSTHPEVNILYHENDVVPTIGSRWGAGWNLYRIYLERKAFPLEAHIKCFVAEPKHLIVKIDSKKDENKLSRLLLSYLHFIFSFLLFPIGLIIYLFQKIIGTVLAKLVKPFFL